MMYIILLFYYFNAFWNGIWSKKVSQERLEFPRIFLFISCCAIFGIAHTNYTSPAKVENGIVGSTSECTPFFKQQQPTNKNIIEQNWIRSKSYGSWA